MGQEACPFASRGQDWKTALSNSLLLQKGQGGGVSGLLFSRFLPDLFSSWKLSWGWKEWRLGWPGGLGREAGENTFQILIKSLFVVCSLKPLLSLFSPVWVSRFLYLFLSHSLPHISPSPISVTLSSFLNLHVSKSLSVSLSSGPSILGTPLLSASTSVRLSQSLSICPSLSLCLCVGVSVQLFYHPSVWLSVLVLLRGPTPSLRHPSPGQQRPLLVQGMGWGYRVAASGSFSSSWAELGVRASQLQKRPLPWAPRPRTPEQKEERKQGLTTAEFVYVCEGGGRGPHFASTSSFPPKPGPAGEGYSVPIFLTPSQWKRHWDPEGRRWEMPGLGGRRS